MVLINVENCFHITHNTRNYTIVKHLPELHSCHTPLLDPNALPWATISGDDNIGDGSIVCDNIHEYLTDTATFIEIYDDDNVLIERREGPLTKEQIKDILTTYIRQ